MKEKKFLTEEESNELIDSIGENVVMYLTDAMAKEFYQEAGITVNYTILTRCVAEAFGEIAESASFGALFNNLSMQLSEKIRPLLLRDNLFSGSDIYKIRTIKERC